MIWKWILFKEVKPKDNQECIICAHCEGTFYIWQAMYVGNEKFLITEFVSNSILESWMETICWMPMPRSPFKNILQED